MRKLRLLGSLILWICLSGFSDPRGYYTLDIPPNWSFVPSLSTADISDYAPHGETRQGGIVIMRDAKYPAGTTLEDIFKTYRNPDSSDISEEKVLVAGRECLHAVVASHGRNGIPARGHYLVCDLLGAPYPNATVSFLITVGAAANNNYGIDADAVFWTLIQSIKWTK